MIKAEVVDDEKVGHVWAVVYPPSYLPPTNTDQLASVENLDIVYLGSVGNDMFEGTYYNFTEYGTYRILVHADDGDNLLAQPQVIEIEVLKPVVEEETPNVEAEPQENPEQNQTVEAPKPEEDDPEKKLFLPFVSR